MQTCQNSVGNLECLPAPLILFNPQRRTTVRTCRSHRVYKPVFIQLYIQLVLSVLQLLVTVNCHWYTCPKDLSIIVTCALRNKMGDRRHFAVRILSRLIIAKSARTFLSPVLSFKSTLAFLELDSVAASRPKRVETSKESYSFLKCVLAARAVSKTLASFKTA